MRLFTFCSRGIAPDPAVLTSRADRVLQINRPGHETISIEFDAVLDSSEVENDTVRPERISSCWPFGRGFGPHLAPGLARVI